MLNVKSKNIFKIILEDLDLKSIVRYSRKRHLITGVRQQRAKSTVPVSPLSPSTKTL